MNEIRRREVEIPNPVLQPRHTEGGRLVSSREALLDAIPKGGIAAEIGVSGGDFAAEILARCAVRRLHLIDPWIGARYEPDLERVQSRFADEIAAGTVEINRGFSETVLAGFPDAYFDWVYIDSDHSFVITRSELAIARHKVKPGGRIAGHDFCLGNIRKSLRYGVIQAVNDFCVEHDWGYEYLTVESHGHFSFCIRAL